MEFVNKILSANFDTFSPLNTYFQNMKDLDRFDYSNIFLSSETIVNTIIDLSFFLDRKLIYYK